MGNKMTLEDLASKIKKLVSKSALANIEIGELLNEYTDEIEHGKKKEFYKSIGMPATTAQYYKRIAANEEVQKLKKEGKLDGLNMSHILELCDMRVNIRGTNNDNAPQKNQPYTALGYGKFDFTKSHTIKEFRAEYKELNDRVSELEAELEALRSQTA